jgi:hypothetical protein
LNFSRKSRHALLATSKPSTKNLGWVPTRITIGYNIIIENSLLQKKGFHPKGQLSNCKIVEPWLSRILSFLLTYVITHETLVYILLMFPKHNELRKNFSAYLQVYKKKENV